MKVSYECEELIKELKKDIKEFGNINMYAFFEEIEGFTFITNYDFIVDENPLNIEDLKNGVIAKIMTANEILKILEEQNSIL